MPRCGDRLGMIDRAAHRAAVSDLAGCRAGSVFGRFAVIKRMIRERQIDIPGMLAVAGIALVPRLQTRRGLRRRQRCIVRLTRRGPGLAVITLGAAGAGKPRVRTILICGRHRHTAAPVMPERGDRFSLAHFAAAAIPGDISAPLASCLDRCRLVKPVTAIRTDHPHPDIGVHLKRRHIALERYRVGHGLGRGRLTAGLAAVVGELVLVLDRVLNGIGLFDLDPSLRRTEIAQEEESDEQAQNDDRRKNDCPDVCLLSHFFCITSI